MSSEQKKLLDGTKIFPLDKESNFSDVRSNSMNFVQEYYVEDGSEGDALAVEPGNLVPEHMMEAKYQLQSACIHAPNPAN